MTYIFFLSITDIHVFDLQFPLYPSPEARVDRIERRREHIRTVSIYGEVNMSNDCYDNYDNDIDNDNDNDHHCAQVWDMVEERALQLAPPPGVAALDPLMQLQQNLAALNQVSLDFPSNPHYMTFRLQISHINIHVHCSGYPKPYP